MLYESTLKNLWKNEYKLFLKKLGTKNLSKRLHTSYSYDYSNIITVIKEELADTQSKLTTEVIDNFLFDNFFYNNNNYHFIYRIHSFVEFKDLTVSHIESYLKGNPEIKFNESLINFKPNSDLKLCSTRIDSSDGIVSSINLLIYVGKVSTKRGEIDLYTAVQIDLSKKLIAIKFNLNLFENHHYEKMFIVDKIKTKLISDTDVFKSLELRIKSHNETQIRRTIHTLFRELSEQAESLLNNKVPPETEEKISKFLQSMDIENNKEYLNQVKAVIYQDISRTFNKSLFDNGWIFRFVFREGDTTRASSTTDDYEPIYSKKVYWNLKELLFKSTELIETGILWNTDKNTKPVLVRLEQKNSNLIVYYYQEKNKEARKEKENFVLQKIDRYLP